MTTQRPSPHHADDVAHARAGVQIADVADTRPSNTDRHRGAGERWRSFSRRWGWRAYAVPILAVVTVAALLRTGGSGAASPPAASGGSHSGNAAPPPASPSTVLKKDSGNGPLNNTALEAAALPAGPAYTTKGDGTFRILKGTSSVAGTTGRLWRYSVDVENGITGVNLTQFADLVQQTLADPRSWSGHGIRIERVDSGPVDFHVTLTSSLTVRKYCGYDIHAESSCYAAANSVPGVTLTDNRVFMNVARWVRGAAAYIGDVAEYRVYMINHEDGHALGHIHAHECLSNGMAPAMMQQTFGLKATLTGKFCTANPWPYPPGATDAPGAEQQDTAANNEYGRGD